MKYTLTLEFKIDIETGDKNIIELKKEIEKSYTENCVGEKIVVTKSVKKHNGLFKQFYPNW